jgi:plasmid stabilization system protein ParE
VIYQKYGISTPRRADGRLRIALLGGLSMRAGPLNRHLFSGRPRDEIRPGLRSRATGTHVIFYRVKDDVAEIVRVLDGRRDLERIFDDDMG